MVAPICYVSIFRNRAEVRHRYNAFHKEYRKSISSKRHRIKKKPASTHLTIIFDILHSYWSHQTEYFQIFDRKFNISTCATNNGEVRELSTHSNTWDHLNCEEYCFSRLDWCKQDVKSTAWRRQMQILLLVAVISRSDWPICRCRWQYASRCHDRGHARKKSFYLTSILG